MRSRRINNNVSTSLIVTLSSSRDRVEGVILSGAEGLLNSPSQFVQHLLSGLTGQRLMTYILILTQRFDFAQRDVILSRVETHYLRCSCLSTPNPGLQTPHSRLRTSDWTPTPSSSEFVIPKLYRRFCEPNFLS